MGETGKVEGTGCSAKSFLIQDGVCDEITNTERCLYDGGDCCLEDKQTHICRKCTCHMDFDESKLDKELEELGAAQLISDNIVRFLIVKHVVDVASKMTCSALCFNANKNGLVEIDSIMYFQTSAPRNCSCASFESCFNASHWQSLANASNVTLYHYQDPEVMGLTKKFLPCSNKYPYVSTYLTEKNCNCVFLLFQKLASFMMKNTNLRAFQTIPKLLQPNIARRSARSTNPARTSAGHLTNMWITNIGDLAG